MKSSYLVLFALLLFSHAGFARESLLLTSPVVYKIKRIVITNPIEVKRKLAGDIRQKIMDAAKGSLNTERLIKTDAENNAQGYEGGTEGKIDVDVTPVGAVPSGSVGIHFGTSVSKTKERREEKQQTSSTGESAREIMLLENLLEDTQISGKDMLKVEIELRNLSDVEYCLPQRKVIRGTLKIVNPTNPAEDYRVQILETVPFRDILLKPNLKSVELLTFYYAIPDIDFQTWLKNVISESAAPETSGVLTEYSSFVLESEPKESPTFNGVDYPEYFDHEVQVDFHYGPLKPFSPFYVRHKIDRNRTTLQDVLDAINAQYSAIMDEDAALFETLENHTLRIKGGPTIGKIDSEKQVPLLFINNVAHDVVDTDLLQTPLSQFDKIVFKRVGVKELAKKLSKGWVVASDSTFERFFDQLKASSFSDGPELIGDLLKICEKQQRNEYVKELQWHGDRLTSEEKEIQKHYEESIIAGDKVYAEKYLNTYPYLKKLDGWRIASAAGSWELFDLIREKYTLKDINKVDCLGMTPLMWAALRGDVKTCENLIKQGANVDITIEYDEETVEQRKKVYDKLEQVFSTEKLIALIKETQNTNTYEKLKVNSFDLNRDADCFYSSDLEEVAIKHLDENVGKLHSKKGSLEGKRYYSESDCVLTAVDYAGLFNNNKDVCRYLLGQLWWQKFAKSGKDFPFDIEIMDKLIRACYDAGLNVQILGDAWLENTAVFRAYGFGFYQRDKYVYWRKRPNETRKNDVQILKFLVEQGYQWKSQKSSELKVSPLMLASERGDAETAELFITNCCCDVNQAGEDGKTPLLYALVQYDKLLHGEDGTDLRTYCLDYIMLVVSPAVALGKIAIDKAEADAKAKSIEELRGWLTTQEKPFEKVIAVLLNHGAKLDARMAGDREELTPLTVQEWAVRCIADENLLMRLIPDEVINKKNERGETLLMFAAQAGNADAVKFLLKKGCSVFESFQRGYIMKDEVTAKTLADEEEFSNIVEILDAFEKEKQVDSGDLPNDEKTSNQRE